MNAKVSPSTPLRLEVLGDLRPKRRNLPLRVNQALRRDVVLGKAKASTEQVDRLDFRATYAFVPKTFQDLAQALARCALLLRQPVWAQVALEAVLQKLFVAKRATSSLALPVPWGQPKDALNGIPRKDHFGGSGHLCLALHLPQLAPDQLPGGLQHEIDVLLHLRNGFLPQLLIPSGRRLCGSMLLSRCSQSALQLSPPLLLPCEPVLLALPPQPRRGGVQDSGHREMPFLRGELATHPSSLAIASLAGAAKRRERSCFSCAQGRARGAAVESPAQAAKSDSRPVGGRQAGIDRPPRSRAAHRGPCICLLSCGIRRSSAAYVHAIRSQGHGHAHGR
eukprot:scaffold485_cov272-Pinguiococcus_pyrenoidosus.AAC.8